MELKKAREIGKRCRTLTNPWEEAPYPTFDNIASAATILDDRITELEAQRDDLVAVCRAAVTFPAEYRKHLILFHAIEDKIK